MPMIRPRRWSGTRQLDHRQAAGIKDHGAEPHAQQAGRGGPESSGRPTLLESIAQRQEGRSGQERGEHDHPADRPAILPPLLRQRGDDDAPRVAPTPLQASRML